MSKESLPLIRQIQAEATSVDPSVARLLRLSKLAAENLRQEEALTWMNSELKGYECIREELPEYRVHLGDLLALDPIGGWLPARFEKPEHQEMVCKVGIFQSIGTIEKLVRRSNEDDGSGQLKVEINPQK